MTLWPAASSVGPSEPNSKPRTEYSPPTKKRCPFGTQSTRFLATCSSSVFAQSWRSGKIAPRFVLKLIDVFFEILKNFVKSSVGRNAWIVPPTGPPEYDAVTLKRMPRVTSNGLSRESYWYDGPIVDCVKMKSEMSEIGTLPLMSGARFVS